MYDSAKYLIHADIRASGVVERSDVVGAVFGQTEGLLGEGLDLRDLQESSKLGRIDVEIESERGSSFGEITIASGLDRVETAILAAALESIERVGPCRADIEVSEIEDVRTAKRRRIVERAKELIAEFDETALSSEDLVEEVRRSVRVEDITEFHGLPAGPRVADSDAVVVVEGRSDVGTLLRYGVKNAIAVEGTDVPDEVAELTNERTVTAFLDGDRGGDLILKELAQVGDVDYVALAPSGRSVEDLSRDEVMSALRDKVPFEAVSDAEAGATADLAATDGSTRPAPPEALEEAGPETTADAETAPEATGRDAGPADAAAPEETHDTDQSGTATDPEVADGTADRDDSDQASDAASAPDASGTTADAGATDTGPDTDTDAADGSSAVEAVEAGEASGPETLAGHVAAVVGSETGLVRLLDRDQSVLAEGPAADAFDLVESAETVPVAVVLDGEASQRLLDVAAQRGVEQVVARNEGEYVKQPTDVRVRLASEVG